MKNYKIVSTNERKDRAMIIHNFVTYHCQWDNGRKGWRGKDSRGEWIFFY
jgi:hypothetical protein